MLNSGVATGGQRGGQSAPIDSKTITKKSGKRGKNRKKRGKIGKKRQQLGRSFTLPLLIDRAGYATDVRNVIFYLYKPKLGEIPIFVTFLAQLRPMIY